MKPSFQHLGFDRVDASFLSYWVRSQKFGFHWHYHPECEISFVKRGFGTRMVGDNVEQFQEGDLLMLGPGLPHTLVSGEMMDYDMEVVVVQFPKELLEARSLEIVELGGIGTLIDASARGLVFEGAAQSLIGDKLERLPELEGFTRYHMLLEILNDLASVEGRKLASLAYNPNKSSENEARIGRVCKYVHEHFTEEVTVEGLAALASMNKSAFCRFFKKMTGKTAVSYLNDLRIGMACQLLLKDYAVSEVAFQSGFNSLTHFHRCFAARKKMSPLVYKKYFEHASST